MENQHKEARAILDRLEAALAKAKDGVASVQAKDLESVIAAMRQVVDLADRKPLWAGHNATRKAKDGVRPCGAPPDACGPSP